MTSTGTVVVIATYCVCSSCMLILNKLAVHHVGLPAFVTLLQFAATTGAVLVGRGAGWLEADDYEWAKVKYFCIYVLAFSGGTYSNMRVLMTSNVETVIVFRACAPMAVCIVDYIFHKRALPGARSTLSLLLVGAGAANYVVHDHSFQMGGIAVYFWVMVWFGLLVFQLTYGKYLVSSLGLKSAWTAVLYTNSLSMLPTGAIMLSSGDVSALARIDWTVVGAVWLLLSCAVGLGISWAGFKCQSLITATAYTVVGVRALAPHHPTHFLRSTLRPPPPPPPRHACAPHPPPPARPPAAA